ncbi:PAS domain-containing protein [Alphaproteobacteria bacterium KMM 3653]|uniref:PAS domain-containing protein n=1 Tax=Harenicola maris TaxID=2841044 RepID=A0AAP2G7U9_9RHOB|nr:PAS domain-containing protein [Harenicola maris]
MTQAGTPDESTRPVEATKHRFAGSWSLEFPVLDCLDAHWSALTAQAEGRLPARSDIDPTRFEPALSYTFMAERMAPGTARLRVCGRHINDLMGMELRGMPLTALFGPEARAEVQAVLEKVFTHPARARLNLISPASLGRPVINGQMCLWPLRDGEGAVTRLLGGLATIGPAGRLPRRFEVRGALVRRVGPRAQENEAAAEAQHFAEAQQSFTQAPRPQAGKPNLYVVK